MAEMRMMGQSYAQLAGNGSPSAVGPMSISIYFLESAALEREEGVRCITS